MTTARHVAIVIWSALRFGLSTRNIALVAVIIGGMVLLLVALAAQTAVPFVLYPFA